MKLTQYKHPKINLSKLKSNKSYHKSVRNKLIFFYLYNKYDIDIATKWLYKKQRNQIHIYIRFFDDISFPYNTNKEAIEYVFRDKKCLFCNKSIAHKPKQIYCSNKCSNTHKTKKPEYLKNLSGGVKKWYKNASTEILETKNKNISVGVNKFYNNENKEDKKKRLLKTNNYFSKSWNNQISYCTQNNFKILFTEEIYRKNVEIKYKCNECNNIIISKGNRTTFFRPRCEKCNPITKKKAKTQYSIYQLVLETPIESLYDTKSIITPYELDIVDITNNFAVEYNGLLPHSYGPSPIKWYNFGEENKNYHLKKTTLCEEKNIQLYHIFENEWMNINKREIWKSVIKNKQNLNKKIGARKTLIKEISSKESLLFLESNHLQGNSKASIRIGLFYNDELISLMTFGKSRFNKDVEYELIRFCSKKNYSVQGGASKLITYFEKKYKPLSIISYANRRWSTGGLYKKLGFLKLGNTPPNFFWFKVNENILYNRIKFQKHKLSKELAVFDSLKTASENMFENDYRRIWDSGNIKFIKEYEYE